jgi:aminoglycoside phosphotransferase (APT) family kinase protein
VTEPAVADTEALVEVASGWWPGFEWRAAEVHHGAFHDVLVIRGHVVARLVRHVRVVARLVEEHRTFSVFSAQQSRWTTPKVLSPVCTVPQGGAGMLTSWVSGRHQTSAAWSSVAEEISALVRQVEAGEAFATVGELPAPRAWCGGRRFPRIVSDRLAPLLSSGGAREAATRVVSDMLAAEQTIMPVPVHGDLGMHNILWHDAGADRRTALTISGLIDLDHAAMGDPAIDIAPLLGQFGSAVLSDVLSPAVLSRAMLHRATLSLQVAAAAELRGDEALRNFALSNFDKRHAAGTLHDPDGMLPDR